MSASSDRTTTPRLFLGPGRFAVTEWLVDNVTQVERGPEQVRVELLGYARGRRIEPPTGGRVERIVRSALDCGEKRLMVRICADLPAETRTRWDELVLRVPDEPR